MMFNSMAQAKIDRLTHEANEAIKQYNNDVAGGGEPAYPAWANDLISLVDANERMVRALNEWKQYAINNDMTGENCSFYPLTTEALAAAGAV